MEEGQQTQYALKMLFMMHWDFDMGSLNGNIFKVFFFKGRGHKKEYPVGAFHNVDNSGRLPMIKRKVPESCTAKGKVTISMPESR